MRDTKRPTRSDTKPKTKKPKNPDKTGISGPENPVRNTPKPTSEPSSHQPKAPRRDHLTRFKPGQSGNPNGRPRLKPLSLHESTAAANAVLQSSATRLMAKTVALALEGSPTALRLCLERLVPTLDHRTVSLTKLAAAAKPKSEPTPQSILAGHSALLAAVTSGAITPHDAESVSNLLEAHRRSWESVELADRLLDLEDQASASRSKQPPTVRWADPWDDDPNEPEDDESPDDETNDDESNDDKSKDDASEDAAEDDAAIETKSSPEADSQ